MKSSSGSEISKQALQFVVSNMKKEIETSKQAKSRLLNIENQFWDLLCSSNDAVIIADPETCRISKANPSACSLFNREENTLTGSDLRNLLDGPSPCSGKDLALKFKKTEKGAHQLFEWKLTDKTGRVIWLEITLQRIFFNGGNNILTICRGITYFKSIESELQYKKNIYQGLFENTGTGTAIITSENKIIRANSIFEKITGFSKKEIEGKMTPADFVCKDDISTVNNYRNACSAGGNVPECYYFRLIDKKGRLKYIRATGSRIPGTDKRVVSLTDISSIMTFEKDLTESRKKLSELVKTSSGVFYRYLIDENMTIQFVSSGVLELTGISSEKLKRVSDYTGLIHPDDRQLVFQTISDAIEKRVSFDVDYRIITASGVEKWVKDRSVAIIGNRGEATVIEGIVADNTEARETGRFLEENETIFSELHESLKTPRTRHFKFCNIVGNSDPMKKVYELILKAAVSDACVTIYGESGTGKELVAKAIHEMSPRHQKRFIAVNCGAIPENLLESEFFGYSKGAFTGAYRNKPGFFDLADKGTLFLDEIGNISLHNQTKLLRAIETGEYIPVGSTEVKKSDIRIISATNSNLMESMKKGLIRSDFFFRIHVIPIQLTPLRKRKDDIPILVSHFLNEWGIDDARQYISPEILQALQGYEWPGNVRELQNVLHRFIALNRLELSALPIPSPAENEMAPQPLSTNGSNLRELVNDFEKTLILQTLQKNRWNREKTALELGLPRRTFFSKMKKHDIIPTPEKSH